MNAVDTNVLIYARDPRDPQKQLTAQRLIATLGDGVLLWQVACEYIAASRKLTSLGYDQRQAWADLANLRNIWLPLAPSWNVMNKAEALLSQYSLSFWDALIIAACFENGVERLYSEDFDASVSAIGLEIINPFTV